MILGASAVLSTATPLGAADSISRWQSYISEAAKRFDIPESWIVQVMAAESAGRLTLYGKPIRSSAGAIGLMQLMPGTWKAMRDALQLGGNPDDPHDNIIAGAAYLRSMYDRFGYPGVFAAYNAGPGRYADFLAGKKTLPRETSAYLRTVTAAIGDGEQIISPAMPTLFVVGNGSKGVGSNKIFVIRIYVP